MDSLSLVEKVDLEVGYEKAKGKETEYTPEIKAMNAN
jgi:hypothetical protein